MATSEGGEWRARGSEGAQLPTERQGGACGNSASGAKIRRTGFTWIPDFANTALMIQGATLTAGLADCGEVLDL
eukprot:1349629-Pyramimonas_sp.AAC.1